MGLMPGLGTFPGEENGNPLQCSCLENPMDRGAWRATIRRVTKSWTWLSTSPTQKHGLKITTNSVTSKTEIYAFTLLEARSPKSKCQQGHSTPRDCRGESTGELSLSELLVAASNPWRSLLCAPISPVFVFTLLLLCLCGPPLTHS